MATLIVAVALAGGSVVLVSLLRSMLTDTVRVNAQVHADQVAGSVAASGSAATSLPDDDDRLVQILDSNDDVLRSSSVNLGSAPLSGVAPGDSAVKDVPFDDDGYLVVAADADSPQGRRLILVAHALDGVTESTAALTTLLAIGLPILLALLAGTTWRVVGGALAPVEAIRREVDEVSAQELHRRVPQPAGGDEIARLAATMNRMLARLQDARRAQQQFVSNASHELRSPIASIRTYAEIALTHPDHGSTTELADVVLAESLRVQDLVENMLVLTRADEQRSAPQHRGVDLDDLVFGEARRLRGRASAVVLDTSGVRGPGRR